MYDAQGYPAHSFFAAHRRFDGPFLSGGPEWGDILDGPAADEDTVIDAIRESWEHDSGFPARSTLRVWLVTFGEPVRDMTDWAIQQCREREQGDDE